MPNSLSGRCVEPVLRFKRIVDNEVADDHVCDCHPAYHETGVHRPGWEGVSEPKNRPADRDLRAVSSVQTTTSIQGAHPNLRRRHETEDLR